MKRFELMATVTGLRLGREGHPVMTVRFPLAIGIVDQLDFFNPFGFELGDELQVVIGMDQTPFLNDASSQPSNNSQHTHGYKIDNN